MHQGDVSLKTRQVAQALGVSASTVKRWVTEGKLPAARTVGNHRLIALSDAIAFARNQGMNLTQLEALAESYRSVQTAQTDRSNGHSGSVVVPPPSSWRGGFSTSLSRSEVASDVRAVAGSGSGSGVTLDDCDELFRVLIAGQSQEARDLVLRLHDHTRNAATLTEQLIEPVMRHIGDEWQRGALGIDQEHLASHIMCGIISELIRRVQTDRAFAHSATHAAPRPLALGATPENDWSTLPNLICELALLEQGWEVVNLGCNLPIDSLVRAARRERPNLVWLSASHLKDPLGFIKGIIRLGEHLKAQNAHLIVGGRAVTSEIRSKLVSDLTSDLGETVRVGHSMTDLVQSARELQSDPTWRTA
ncbi:DNA binding domain protein, excisionase family [Isosphaera pallida ATCC 43644]|uniref:DNA binding domain protein, excisionase family n=1 Tax=Isosphaera pallida (strain ATCC 43644 / DSM 9630 / IS1B) TaxID=575540 RepID=E8QXT5_ISOPI|nr:DNA binding domain protein, excisionase family [Isosphaera pallida ATCC 43644]